MTDPAVAPALSPKPHLRAEDHIEASVVAMAYDRLYDAGHRVPIALVKELCRSYVAEIKARGGRL